MITRAYKVLSHDLRSPIQRGAPIFDGSLPFTLPPVQVDATEKECSHGWNACSELATALRIAGLWRDGWPSRVFDCETEHAVFARKDKLRAASWTLTRELSESEIVEGIRQMSAPFGDLQDAITAEQAAWRVALRRPQRESEAVERNLREALAVRGLDWSLRRFDTARAARAAWDSWDSWDARAAWAARAARAAWDSWDARDARDARDAMAAWDAMDAWAAREALTVWYSARRGWMKHDPLLLTTGLRDAYCNGLAIAIPTGPHELGWAMGVAP